MATTVRATNGIEEMERTTICETNVGLRDHDREAIRKRVEKKWTQTHEEHLWNVTEDWRRLSYKTIHQLDSRGSIPTRGREISLRPCDHIDSGAYPGSHPMGTGDNC
jgi:hypothetical protein